ncbi:CLUMA_CG016563, isoform A [Clunio marinus]|uniref:CLUMA_CG016563, isoform A n=1 Tax=Clunio marinus TaxID=568069 RepID=A0A1J1IRY0_9DIPT|nr:CLUMA_CG016563, isoform A [Clunio marinus]
MKFIVILALVMTACLAAPVDDSSNAQILRYENDNIGIGGYRYAYETSDGVAREEEAELRNEGSENEALAVRGSITWTAPDGQVFTLNYIADENGFQPQGDHLPVAPVA